MYHKKIRPKRQGPFPIEKVLGPVTYKLKLPTGWKIHPIFHSVHLTPFKETPQYGPVRISPPPDLIDGEEEYEVDHIVKHRKTCRGQIQYLVRWKGQGPEDDSWEPAKHFKHAKETLGEYKKRHCL
jgi:hypothetical protein